MSPFVHAFVILLSVAKISWHLTQSANADDTCFQMPSEYPDYRLFGLVAVEFYNVENLNECQQHCLRSSIQCKSLIYFASVKECLLNKQNRIDSPKNFLRKPAGESSTYQERLSCLSLITTTTQPTTMARSDAASKTGCFATVKEHVDHRLQNALIHLRYYNIDIAECERLCLLETMFVCLALAYFPDSGECAEFASNHKKQPSYFAVKPSYENSHYLERTDNCIALDNHQNAPCIDEDNLCGFWAAYKECQKNPNYMLLHCKRSCSACTITAVTTPEPLPSRLTPPVWQNTGRFGQDMATDVIFNPMPQWQGKPYQPFRAKHKR